MTLESLSFEGHACVRLTGDAGSVVITTSVGPRILGLFGRGDNLLAVLPGSMLEHPSGPPLRLIGGHRLWAAPEVPRVTYEPDDRPCMVTDLDDGVRVQALVDGAGLRKAIEVHPAPSSWADHGWIVDHEIHNASGAPIRLAPWAITQFPLGGEIVVPAPTGETGLQADRALVLWPYTDPGDERLRLGPSDIRVEAEPGPRRLKVGLASGRGCVSYRRGAEVFEKRADVDPRASYADLGAAIQVFVCDDFCELESLGPLRTVAPDESVHHQERWTLGSAEDAS